MRRSSGARGRAPPMPTGASVRGRAVAVGGRAVDPREEAAAGAGRRRPASPASAAAHLGFERRAPCRCRSRAARTPSYASSVGERPAGQQVVLVGREHEPAAERGAEPRLPALDRCRASPRLRARVCGRISGSRLCALTPSGTTPSVASCGNRSSTPSSVSSSTAPSLMPGHTTTWPCTSMPASSSSASQRRLVAPRRLRSRRVAHVGIGGVDAHVQRAEPLGDDPLEVGLGEAGERREVPVEERQPVVVVLQVQAAAACPSAAGR